MRHFTRHRWAAAAGGLLLVALTVPPAAAEDTTTTFTLTGNGIAVSVPGSAPLSASTFIGTTSISGSLGTVEVTDNRGALLGSWTATVSSSDFVTPAQASNNVISKANISYNSGVVGTLDDGIAVPVGTVTAVTLEASKTAVATTGVIGSATVSWNPTISVTVPSDVVAGDYEGTITHSVA